MQQYTAAIYSTKQLALQNTLASAAFTLNTDTRAVENDLGFYFRSLCFHRGPSRIFSSFHHEHAHQISCFWVSCPCKVYAGHRGVGEHHETMGISPSSSTTFIGKACGTWNSTCHTYRHNLKDYSLSPSAFSNCNETDKAPIFVIRIRNRVKDPLSFFKG